MSRSSRAGCAAPARPSWSGCAARAAPPAPSAEGRNRDVGAGVALEALREMVAAGDAQPSAGLSLFAEPAGDPVAELLDSYEEAVEEYGQAAAHGAVDSKDPAEVAAVVGRVFVRR